jgi:hypothetical protein
MRTVDVLTSKGLAGVGLLAVTLSAGFVRADDKAPGNDAKPAVKALCDENWEGGFWTVEVNQLKNDGKTPLSKAYNPERLLEPWLAPEGQYLRMGYYQDPDRRNKGLAPNQIVKMIGRFDDKKKADEFLKKMYGDSRFASNLNPRYPPFVSSPGALLVSEKYTCTLNKENDTLSKAAWIVEVDGHLFAGAESSCKQGKKKKTVSILDCEGKKTLATDSWSAPCDGSRVDSCVFPMSPGVAGIRHDYSASEEGRQTSFRVYDLSRGRQLATFTGGGDWEAQGGTFCSFEDRDGDGVPEIVNTECESSEKCAEVRIRKWKKDRFIDVKLKP